VSDSKRVIITGAASGIGAASAQALRERGARVVGLDLNPGEDTIACDVTDQKSVERAMKEAIERLGGGADALVNCAGIGLPQSAIEPPGPDALRVLDVNLLGTWRATAAALPALRESRGRVVNVSSGLAHIAVPFATAYGASKRGVVGYSEQLRSEVGDEITVTTVYPGYIRTPIHDASRTAGASLEGMVPPEPIEAAVGTIVRAIYGRPARDLATTRRGAMSYRLLGLLPKGLVERGIRRQMRTGAKRGLLKQTSMTSDLLARLHR
jgi:NAD(P)-dependent dehydrogenase (short-subunit alcohol dehydrogenase family)